MKKREESPHLRGVGGADFSGACLWRGRPAKNSHLSPVAKILFLAAMR
jgi:hypothetical protein